MLGASSRLFFIHVIKMSKNLFSFFNVVYIYLLGIFSSHFFDIITMYLFSVVELVITYMWESFDIFVYIHSTQSLIISESL